MKGKWIWLNDQIKEDTYGEFVGQFVPSGKTYIELSADTEYAIFVNDKFVYQGQYADFPWYKNYDKIDITGYLIDGTNSISIGVWFMGDTNFCHYVNKPCLCFDIVSNGNIVLSSSKDIKSRPYPYFVNGCKKLITSQIGYSFRLDYTLPLSEFKDSKELDINYSTYLRNIKLLNILPKKKAKKISDNIYDLGEETVGLLYMILNSKEKEETLVSFSEHFDKDGNLPRIIAQRDFSFTIISDGEREVFNAFRKIGCRYFQVFTNADIEEIGLIPIEYPFEEKENNLGLTKLEQKIYDTSIKTLKLNAFEHYFDCPWREQGFYALDSRFQMRYGYKVFNGYEYQKAALKLMSEDRNESGLISITVPTSCKLVIPSFALFYIVAMEEYLTNTGDNSLAVKYYDKIESVLNVFINNMEGGLVQNFFGENYWNFYEWKPTLDNVSYKYDCALNLTFLLALKSMLVITKMVKGESEYKYYDNLFKLVSSKVNKEFYSEKDGLYYTTKDTPFSELVNSYAILTGVANGERAYSVAKRLSCENNGLIPCTLSMLSFKYDALLMVSKDYGEYVINDINKNYKYMLDNNATSFWETLIGADDFDGAGSLCHGWSALPVYYYNIIKK